VLPILPPPPPSLREGGNDERGGLGVSGSRVFRGGGHPIGAGHGLRGKQLRHTKEVVCGADEVPSELRSF